MTVVGGFWPSEGSDMSTLRILAVGAMAFALVYAAAPATAQNPPPGITNPPASAPAVPPAFLEALQAANDLVSVVSGSMIAQMSAQATSQIWPQIEAALRAQKSAIDAATIAELRQEFDALLKNSVADLMKDAPTVYVRYFTAQEMRELAAFYRTPTGAKTLRLTSQVSADLLAAMAPHLQGLQEKINLAFLNTLQKRGLYAQ